MRTPPPIDEFRIASVRSGLLNWFAAHRRDLPWRQTRDPYRILVSEVMLQQTQVDRVLPYYASFLQRFPTVESLASASTSDVIQIWAGLGYNRRAVNLQRTAQAVMTNHGGLFPETVAELRALPGIGPYTAGALLCFAFEQDVAFVDTNMRRVIHRLLAGPEVPDALLTERDILEHAARLLPAGEGWLWNQALIEFGALQCTARKPACLVCPLQQQCAAYPVILSALTALPKGTRRKQEPPFAGSNRYYRGRVVDALRDRPDGISLTDLGTSLRDDYTDRDLPWLVDLVRGLERDGLAVAEEPPDYSTDTDAAEPGAGLRVRLPD